MPFSSRDVVLGIVLPAVIALVVTAVPALFSRKRDVTGIAAAPAVVLGFLLSYWLLKLGPIVPKISREWLPYSAVFALCPALIPNRGRLFSTLRLIALAAAVTLAAWLLIPDRETLEPSRTVHFIVWWIYTFSLCVGMVSLAPVGKRPDPSATGGETVSCSSSAGGLLLLLLMISTLTASSGFFVLGGSFGTCQMTLAAAAALTGFAIAYGIADRYFQFRTSLSGVTLVYSLLISAAMLTRKVDSFSSIPAVSYMLLPLTPLAFGLSLPARSGTLTWKRVVLMLLAAIVISGLAIGLALVVEFGGESEY